MAAAAPAVEEPPLQHPEFRPDEAVEGTPLPASPDGTTVGHPITAGALLDFDEEPSSTARSAQRSGRALAAQLMGQRSQWFGAAKSGDVGNLRRILERGAINVNARGDWGMTA